MKKKSLPLFILFTLIIINPFGLSTDRNGTYCAQGGRPEPSDNITIVTYASYILTGGEYVPTSGSISTAPKPTDEPSFEAIPSEPPEASTGSTKQYLYHGESPPINELESLGGKLEEEGNLQYYILYNNKWSIDPTAFWLDDKTNTLSYVDVPQHIVYFEKYPDGEAIITEWGHMQKGLYPASFVADEKGWHRVAIWGSVSGWSDVVWIYVH